MTKRVRTLSGLESVKKTKAEIHDIVLECQREQIAGNKPKADDIFHYELLPTIQDELTSEIKGRSMKWGIERDEYQSFVLAACIEAIKKFGGDAELNFIGLIITIAKDTYNKERDKGNTDTRSNTKKRGKGWDIINLETPLRGGKGGDAEGSLLDVVHKGIDPVFRELWMQEDEERAKKMLAEYVGNSTFNERYKEIVLALVGSGGIENKEKFLELLGANEYSTSLRKTVERTRMSFCKHVVASSQD